MSYERRLSYPNAESFASSFQERHDGTTLLSGRIGGGLTAACQLAIARVMEDKKSRVLVLAPRPLAEYWRVSLQKSGIRSLYADRSCIRKLQIETADESDSPIWPEGVTTLSIDTAKLPNIAGLVLETSWDLVVVDEAHLLRGQRGTLLQSLLKAGCAKRVLLATHTPNEQLRGLVPHLTEALIGSESKLPQEVREPTQLYQRDVIEYHRSSEERCFVDSLVNLLDALPSTSDGKATKELVLRMAASSLWAVAAYFSSLLTRRTPGLTGDEADRGYKEAPRSAVSEVDTDYWFEPEGLGFGLWEGVTQAAIDQVLIQLENIAEEQKHIAILHYVDSLVDGESPCRFCVFTDFGSTAEFLERELSSTAECKALGTLWPDKTVERVEWFRQCGGILIIPTQMSRFAAFRVPIHAIHYDLPGTPTGMMARRSGLAAGSIESVLVDRSHVLQLESRLLQMNGFVRR